MLKLLILSVIIGSALSVSEWGQCGGINYSGSTSCDSGLACIKQNDYYFQCQKSSSATTTAATTTKAATTAATTTKAATTAATTTKAATTAATTTKAGSTTTAAATTTTAKVTTTTAAATTTASSSNKFPYGKFKIGRNYDGDGKDYSSFDYISIWINTISSDFGTDYNPYYQRPMIKKAVSLNKMPLFYSYVIAFQARKDKGLQDCDVDPNYNLCTNGAQYIRDNKELLISRYEHQAKNIAADLGANKECIFVMEPDLWQYYGDSHQKGGPLSGTEMRSLLDAFVAKIKQYLPNARISWDISAWIGESGMTTWWSFFKTADYIDYIHTSGGRANANTATIKPNELTWKFVNTVTGKKIIADCGYGIGGAPDVANCLLWKDKANMDARVSDGVIALTASNLEAYDIPSYKPAV